MPHDRGHARVRRQKREHKRITCGTRDVAWTCITHAEASFPRTTPSCRLAAARSSHAPLDGAGWRSVARLPTRRRRRGGRGHLPPPPCVHDGTPRHAVHARGELHRGVGAEGRRLTLTRTLKDGVAQCRGRRKPSPPTSTADSFLRHAYTFCIVPYLKCVILTGFSLGAF